MPPSRCILACLTEAITHKIFLLGSSVFPVLTTLELFLLFHLPRALYDHKPSSRRLVVFSTVNIYIITVCFSRPLKLTRHSRPSVCANAGGEETNAEERKKGKKEKGRAEGKQNEEREKEEDKGCGVCARPHKP